MDKKRKLDLSDDETCAEKQAKFDEADVDDSADGDGMNVSQQSERDEEDMSNIVTMSSMPIKSNFIYKPGDLVWASVSKFPWWPAFVAVEFGDSTTFTKISTFRACNTRVYHVIFFGPFPEHNWVAESRLYPFKNRQDYFDECARLKSSKSKSDKRMAQQIAMKKNLEAAWEQSCEEIAKSSTMPTDERIDFYTKRHFEKADEVFQKKLAKIVGRKSAPGAITSASAGELTVPAEGSASLSVKKEPKKRKTDIPRKSKSYTSPDSSVKRGSESIASDGSAYSDEDSEDEKENHTAKQKVSPVKKRAAANLELLSAQEKFRMFCWKFKMQVQACFPTFDYGQVKTYLERVWACYSVDEQHTLINSVDSLDLSFSRHTELSTDPHAKPVNKQLANVVKPSHSLLGNYALEVYRLTASYPLKPVEHLCHICNLAFTKEDTSQVSAITICTGGCKCQFHTDCIDKRFIKLRQEKTFGGKPIADNPIEGTDWICPRCKENDHPCFLCDEKPTEDTPTITCPLSKCGRFYHLACLKKHRLAKFEARSGALIQCPAHQCMTCSADNPRNPDASKGRLMRCIQCPNAFHAGDFCVSAGTHVLSNAFVNCADHFQPQLRASSAGKAEKSKPTQQMNVNVAWCFVCNGGGDLLCCDQCPAAFHDACIDDASRTNGKLPDGGFRCADCYENKRPLLGDIVWVKCGHFRWWPCEVYHYDNAPGNIKKQRYAQEVGNFVVRFFGTGEYAWMHRGRVFPYQEGDTGNQSCNSKHTRALFAKAVVEAAAAFAEWRVFKARQQEKLQDAKESNGRAANKPAPYKHIASNIPLGSVQIYKKDPKELEVCECKPDPKTGVTCANDTTCMNRVMHYECHPDVCPGGANCANQRFVKRWYPQCEPVRTSGCGWGLLSLEKLPPGRFVGEYIGELIDDAEVERRLKVAKESGVCNFYFLTLDKNRTIDAGPKANLTRFMNHSCDPNCVAQKWTVNGDIRVGLFTNGTVEVGEELTFNYQLDAKGTEKLPCRCGSANCSGLIGVKPKTQSQMAIEVAKEKKERKSQKKGAVDIVEKTEVPEFEHEDFCFRCGDGGELLLCDRKNCPKTYHITCLGLTKAPKGQWFCPYHHCVTCGKSAGRQCKICPNAYCKAHDVADETLKVYKGKVYCCDHTNNDIDEWWSLQARLAEARKLQTDAEVRNVNEDIGLQKRKKRASEGRKSSKQLPKDEPDDLPTGA